MYPTSEGRPPDSPGDQWRQRIADRGSEAMWGNESIWTMDIVNENHGMQTNTPKTSENPSEKVSKLSDIQILNRAFQGHANQIEAWHGCIGKFDTICSNLKTLKFCYIWLWMDINWARFCPPKKPHLGLLCGFQTSNLNLLALVTGERKSECRVAETCQMPHHLLYTSSPQHDLSAPAMLRDLIRKVCKFLSIIAALATAVSILKLFLANSEFEMFELRNATPPTCQWYSYSML